MKKSKKNNSKQIIIICVAIAALFVTGIFIYRKVSNKNDADTEVKTTSTAPSAQTNYSAGDSRSPTSNDSGKGSAVIEDTQGQQDSTPDQAQWSTSKTGEITVYEPAKNQLAAKGTSIAGASTLKVVYYRIIDDISGMIAQGQLTVVNGKFSGTLSFNTTAANGRIDVYGALDSGKEFSNIEVPIRFK